MERHRILPPTPCLPYRPHPPVKTRVGKKGGDPKFDSTTRDAMKPALNDALSRASRRGVKNGRGRASTVAGTGAGELSGGNPQSQRHVCMAGQG